MMQDWEEQREVFVHWDTNSGWMTLSGRSGRQNPRKTGPED